ARREPCAQQDEHRTGGERRQQQRQRRAHGARLVGGQHGTRDDRAGNEAEHGREHQRQERAHAPLTLNVECRVLGPIGSPPLAQPVRDNRLPLLAWAALAAVAIALAIVQLDACVLAPDAARFTFDSAEYALAGRTWLESGRLATPFVHPSAA